jgi:hypothetical protein
MGARNWKLTEVLVDINKWQHVAVVFGTSGVKFFKNGNMYYSGKKTPSSKRSISSVAAWTASLFFSCTSCARQCQDAATGRSPEPGPGLSGDELPGSEGKPSVEGVSAPNLQLPHFLAIGVFPRRSEI